MSLALEVGNLLENYSFGTVEEDILGFEKQDNPANAIFIIPSAGSPHEIIRESGIQIIVRNEDTEICEEKANEIYEFLRSLDNVNLGSFYIYDIETESDLIPLGFDNKQRYEISMNFSFLRR